MDDRAFLVAHLAPAVVSTFNGRPPLGFSRPGQKSQPPASIMTCFSIAAGLVDGPVGCRGIRVDALGFPYVRSDLLRISHVVCALVSFPSLVAIASWTWLDLRLGLVCYRLLLI